MPTVTEINDFSRFFELRHGWNQILERSRDNHIYLTWEYLLTCWKHFGTAKRLRILCIEDKNKIVAIVPLRQSRYTFVDSLGYNVIEPLGLGNAPYTGLILAEREAECLKLFLNHLVEHDDWDFVYLFDIPETSVIPKLLPKISEVVPTFEFEEGVHSICPYISIPNSLDVFMKGLSKKFRNNLRRCMRNLKKDFQRVELKRYDEFGSVEEAMKIFFELHQERWKSQGMPGVFHNQKIYDFGLDVAKRFASNGWLALYFLTANDEPIAVANCYIYKQKMYYGLSGFDPDYSQYSPGNLIAMKMTEKCIQMEIKEYDFLKGGLPYKFRLCANYRRNLNIRFVNKRFTSKLYHRGIKTVKRMKVDKVLGKFLNF